MQFGPKSTGQLGSGQPTLVVIVIGKSLPSTSDTGFRNMRTVLIDSKKRLAYRHNNPNFDPLVMSIQLLSRVGCPIDEVRDQRPYI